MSNGDSSKVMDTMLIPQTTDNRIKILDTIKQNFDVSKTGEITENTVFESIWLDSITFIKMIVMLEDTYDVEFDDDKLIVAEFPTVKTLIEYVDAQLKTK